MSELPDRRLLLVHAHPDDETINNGVTMARYVDEGAHVTLVTCTLGEEGEVLVPELTHLAADQTDQLGRHRIGELAAAMDELGVTDYRWLGGPGKYRDTGMIYDDEGNAAVPPETRPDSFWQADLLTAANDLVPVIREIRPQVLVTYDQFGNYGHPHHLNAHRVATYAAAVPAAPSNREDLGEAWEVPKIDWIALA
jgi:N-acetyl-1-D-myo-inositol-2-amino-2-deoxy-alpha-D-glucopyranoside deacetylase